MPVFSFWLNANAIAHLSYAGLRGDTAGAAANEDSVPAGEQAVDPLDTIPDAMALLAINPDYIGWIRIEGIGIDYPILKTGPQSAKKSSCTPDPMLKLIYG